MMIDFNRLDICDEIKSILNQYKVDFVFQPVFDCEGELYGYEALMRPEGCNVVDFINNMIDEGKLHDVELLTFFGASLSYTDRAYNCKLGLNTFPEDVFTYEEAMEYSRYFGFMEDKMVLEILEYTEEQHWTWERKRCHIQKYMGVDVALDDFGTGFNDFNAIEYYSPDVIKLDRELISDIHNKSEKQHVVKAIIDQLKDKSILILAEGIEQKEEYDYLYEIGVDYFQGYYLGKPA